MAPELLKHAFLHSYLKIGLKRLTLQIAPRSIKKLGTCHRQKVGGTVHSIIQFVVSYIGTGPSREERRPGEKAKNFC